MQITITPANATLTVTKADVMRAALRLGLDARHGKGPQMRR